MRSPQNKTEFEALERHAMECLKRLSRHLYYTEANVLRAYIAELLKHTVLPPHLYFDLITPQEEAKIDELIHKE